MTSDIFNHNRSHGRFAPFISFQRTEHYGLSAIATQDIPSGSELVICAHEFAITPDLARRVLDLPQTLEDRQTVVAFLVLGRKSEASPAREKLAPWLAYIQALPSPDQLNTPLFFNDEELALFQGTNMVGAIADRRQLWREEVESLDKVLREKLINLVVTFEDYVWAATILSSRAFSSSLIDGDDSNSTPVLFPGVDMLNHNPQAKVLWHCKDKELSIVTEQNVTHGGQVFNNYGPKSNEELFLGYGFVIEDNPADLVALKLGAGSHSPLSNQATKIMNTLQLSGARHIIQRGGATPDALKAHVRILTADEDDLAEIQQRLVEYKQKNVNLNDLTFLESSDNELNLYDQLKSLIAAKIQAIEANTRLSEYSLQRIRPHIRKMVDIYRKGQLEILQDALLEAERQFDQTYESYAAAYGEEDDEGQN